MIGFSANLNSVRVPMIPKGCLKAEFDSAYPVHLNGIITTSEFQQSIDNINRAVSAKKTAIVLLTIILILSTIGGMVCFLLSAFAVTHTYRYRYSILIIAGVILSMLGSIVFSVGMYLIHSARMKRLREAVAQESSKYSSRSPVPCSWRLNISNSWNRRFRYRRNGQSLYDLVIDIGNFAVGSPHGGAVHYSTQPPLYPTVGLPGQETFAPPPYPAQATMQICSRCGTPKQDLHAKTCPTCGEMFHPY